MNNVPKSFFEVFPALKLEGILEGLCQQIQVEKVTSNKMGNRIKVYIVSKKLVQKEQLFCLEKNIKEQLFPRSNVNIVIVERFELSEAYTPKNLFDAYEESGVSTPALYCPSWSGSSSFLLYTKSSWSNTVIISNVSEGNS